MVDLAEINWFDRVAIWEAACGHPGRLAKQIRAGAQMDDGDREALAMLVEGKLVPPPRGRGRQSVRPDMATKFADRDGRYAIATAALHYAHPSLAQMDPDARIAELCKFYRVDGERLRNRIRRPRKVQPERPQDDDVIGQFNYWCQSEQGAMVAYPAPK